MENENKLNFDPLNFHRDFCFYSGSYEKFKNNKKGALTIIKDFINIESDQSSKLNLENEVNKNKQFLCLLQAKFEK